MRYQLKCRLGRFGAIVLRGSAKFAGVIALITAVAVGVSLASSPARAATAGPSAAAARMTEAVAYVRAHDKALAHASDRKIEVLILGVAKDASVTAPAARRGVRPAILGVTKTGHTLWFNRAVVAVWAAAGLALVIASLIYWGVAVETAYEYGSAAVGLFWAAVAQHRCAWFTYSPVSYGTYAC